MFLLQLSRGQAMMRAIQYTHHPTGPRCWIIGQRVHHGAAGLVLAALLRRRWRLASACLVLAAHDYRDWRRWFAREKMPATSLDHRSADL